jgi:hypothetical protein
MRRSICYCEPSVAYAGEVNSWKFVYTPNVDLPKGTKFNFDPQSKTRNIDWEIPSTNLKSDRNMIFAVLNGKTYPLKKLENPDLFAPSFEFVLPSKLEAGVPLTIVMGAPKNAKQNGTRAQTNAQRRRVFSLFVDPTGKGKYEEAETFHIDVRGNQLASIRVLAPSFVVRNKRFDVIVRFEDEYGNLTNQAAADTLVELSHEHLRENLSWKLFVPETGFIALPNLYFNEAGIYTIRLLNTKTKQVSNSAPIKCFAENSRHLFWGVLHGESDRIDSTENIENCLRHFRDDRAANFYASSPFENQEETSNETWKLITQNLSDFDEADRFTTFVGFQWAGVAGEEGVRQIIYAKEQKQLLRKKDPKYSSLKKLYKCFSPKELLSIPCFTTGKGFEFDFSAFEPDYERVVEIYNAWGSSECTAKAGNPLPIKAAGKKGVQESAEGVLIKALQNNCRFGFVAGGLDDRGIYSGFFEGDQVQYTPGLTAIITAEHSRAALFEALYNRSCYATTGEKIILGIYLAGMPMGTETSSAVKHGLNINRHLSGYAAGTAKIKKVEIVRNGKVIKTFESDSYWLDFTYDDMVPLEQVVIDAKDKKPPFVFYYVRFTQEDGHMAWSSPIWIDYIEGATISKPVRRSTGKPVKQPISFVEEEEDDDDFEDDDLE